MLVSIYQMKLKLLKIIYSNKKITSNFHGIVYINPVKMPQRK